VAGGREGPRVPGHGLGGGRALLGEEGAQRREQAHPTGAGGAGPGAQPGAVPQVLQAGERVGAAEDRLSDGHLGPGAQRGQAQEIGPGGRVEGGPRPLEDRPQRALSAQAPLAVQQVEGAGQAGAQAGGAEQVGA
ncbi:MAG: hypothetical protein ACK559_37495, partial [bacterium]